MQIDTPIVAALAALTGSVVGACSSLAATFVGHRLQARWSRLSNRLRSTRGTLWKICRRSCTAVHRCASTTSNGPG